jgi:ABC-type Fe3+-siderophore transport system permease subunit
MILLLALTVLGTSFQVLVKEYLTDNTVSGLKQDAQVIADLAAAYSTEGSIANRDFLLNLDIAAQVTDSDAVIFHSEGHVLLCSNGLMGCKH